MDMSDKERRIVEAAEVRFRKTLLKIMDLEGGHLCSVACQVVIAIRIRKVGGIRAPEILQRVVLMAATQFLSFRTC